MGAKVVKWFFVCGYPLFMVFFVCGYSFVCGCSLFMVCGYF